MTAPSRKTNKVKPLSVKARVLDMLAKMPDDCTIEDVQQALYIYVCVLQSELEIEAGAELIPHEEVVRRMRRRIAAAKRKAAAKPR